MFASTSQGGPHRALTVEGGRKVIRQQVQGVGEVVLLPDV